MKFSVIIPVYNDENVVGRCISSVLQQSFNDFELILVNDGSTDNTLNVIRSFEKQDERISVYDKKNGGASSARNYGLKFAKGDYIVFIDSDDEVKARYLECFDNSDSDLIISGIDIKYTDNIGSTVPKNEKFEKGMFNKLLNEYSHLPILRGPCVKAFKRSILQDNNLKFDLNLKWGEDYLFVLKFLLKCNSVETISQSNYILLA